MEIKFVKVCGYWFVDNLCNIDGVLDMQMISGADVLLDHILKITGNDCYVYLEVLDGKSERQPDIILEKISEDEIGADYSVSTNGETVGSAPVKKLWLCNVNKEVLGEHPQIIKVKILQK